MTPLALWRYEVRRTGWAAPLTPAVGGALVLLLAGLQAGGPAADVQVARTLHGILEMGMPLAAGVVAGAVVGRDRAVELQLSVYRSYRGTLLRRLAIVFGWTAAVAVLATVVMTATGWWDRWQPAPGPVLGQLSWLAPAAFLGGLGFLLAAVLRAPAAAGGLVAAVWLTQQLLGDTIREQAWPVYLFATTRGGGHDWLTNRLVLLTTGAALTAAAVLVLARGELLLEGED